MKPVAVIGAVGILFVFASAWSQNSDKEQSGQALSEGESAREAIAAHVAHGV